MLEHAGAGGWAGKRVAISGSGNVAQYAALKAIALGATIVSLSDSKGPLIATDDAGITPDLVHTIAHLNVKPFSPTSVRSPAANKLRSCFRAHCSSTE